MRADHALGRAGGAGGVEDGERIAGLHAAGADRRFGAGRPWRGAPRAPSVGGTLRRPRSPTTQIARRLVLREVRRRRAARRSCVLDHQQPRPAVGQEVLDLRPHRRRVDRHRRPRRSSRSRGTSRGIRRGCRTSARPGRRAARRPRARRRRAAPRRVGRIARATSARRRSTAAAASPNAAAWRCSIAGSVRSRGGSAAQSSSAAPAEVGGLHARVARPVAATRRVSAISPVSST